MVSSGVISLIQKLKWHMGMEMIGKKKFGIFIKALHKEVDANQIVFVNDLFIALDIDREADADVLKNWMAGRNQGYVGYFKGVEIKQEQNDKFLKLLDEIIKVRYKNIQSTLIDYKNEFTYLDFETDNREEFFKSVLNQFKDIVGLPPDQTIVSTANKSISSDNSEKALKFETPSEQMIKEFDRFIGEYRIAYFICTELSNSKRINDFVETIKLEILARFISDQEEDTYKKISKFIKTLSDFNMLLEDLSPSNARWFWFDITLLRTPGIILYDMQTQIDEDIKRIIERREIQRKVEMQSEQTSFEDIRQLEIIKSLLEMYSQINSLYGTICNGKTLLLF